MFSAALSSYQELNLTIMCVWASVSMCECVGSCASGKMDGPMPVRMACRFGEEGVIFRQGEFCAAEVPGNIPRKGQD